MILAVIDSDEEQVLVSYHGATEQPSAEGERPQQPRISKDEVVPEIHNTLVLSVMVGAPV